ncbi:kinase-like domain-containing protein [Dichotomocladium elegans]|nr:kinase-like domain-containing protein [Dichotomocladium elegans]
MFSHPIDPHSLLYKYIDNRTIQLVALLGVGAYGIVYKGRHVKTDKFYAVKLITNQKDALQHDEVTIHEHHVGHHPNVLGFVKTVRVNKQWKFLILEYAPDGDLFNAITNPESDLVGNDHAIRHIFVQILDAVQHCHERGVAHRDLKPENILMFPDHHVKLADFGLATTQLVSAEFGCGSTFYFSPECQGGLGKNHEQIKGYSTHPNDVWSLGIILINLTAGRNPWRQAAMHDTTFAAYTQHPKGFFKSILPSISAEISDILERIFCLDPARRISLPELRVRILQCPSFTTTTTILPPECLGIAVRTTSQPAVAHPKPSLSAIPTTSCTITPSTALTILNYVDGYTSSEERMSPSWSTSSDGSSASDSPATPRGRSLSYSDHKLLSDTANPPMIFQTIL